MGRLRVVLFSPFSWSTLLFFLYTNFKLLLFFFIPNLYIQRGNNSRETSYIFPSNCLRLDPHNPAKGFSYKYMWEKIFFWLQRNSFVYDNVKDLKPCNKIYISSEKNPQLHMQISVIIILLHDQTSICLGKEIKSF